jgi:CheY-like chemotaxis protein
MRRHRHEVILVDEESTHRSALAARLTDEGFTVLPARHGRAALQLLTLGIRPCVIVVDVLKPSVAGTEFRRALSYEPTFTDIPVLVMRALAPLDQQSSTPLAFARAFDVRALRERADHTCPPSAGFRRPPSHRVADVARRRSRTHRALGG